MKEQTLLLMFLDHAFNSLVSQGGKEGGEGGWREKKEGPGKGGRDEGVRKSRRSENVALCT